VETDGRQSSPLVQGHHDPRAETLAAFGFRGTLPLLALGVGRPDRDRLAGCSGARSAAHAASKPAVVCRNHPIGRVPLSKAHAVGVF
jgi:hypothetical protein